MYSILVLHGPNLNLLGMREPQYYGSQTLAEIDQELLTLGAELGLHVHTCQSNGEGVLIDALHAARQWAAGIVFNPGGYGHTSIALADAVRAIGLPVVEVHLSNILAREDYRARSVIAPACIGVISGFGHYSYALALRALVAHLDDQARTS